MLSNIKISDTNKNRYDWQNISNGHSKAEINTEAILHSTKSTKCNSPVLLLS